MARIPATPRELRARPGRLVLPGLLLRHRPKKPDKRQRVTPFLVLQLTPSDMGVRPVMQAPLPAMRTIVLVDAASPGTAIDFDLRAGKAYVVSGTVTNFGRAPALLGLARLYVLTGAQLAANWTKNVPPFDVTGFSAFPGRRSEFTFRREWVAPKPNGPSERISIFIHVEDMSGDRTPFVVANGHLGERRIVRDDFRLLP
jgi:hypothetical protein